LAGGAEPVLACRPNGKKRARHKLAYALLAGPDGIDGYAVSPLDLDAGVSPRPERPLRIGWLVEPGFGPIEPDAAATVAAAANAFANLGFEVEPVRIPALEENNGLELYSKLHVLETKPVIAEAVAGHAGKVFKFASRILEMPEPSTGDYIAASQAVERLKSGFSAYFQRYDALLCPVTPLPAPPHDQTLYVVNGETVTARQILRTTVPFNLTGLPALSMRFGTCAEGLPFGVQIVSQWFAESTVLHLASSLESVSDVRDLHPSL
jgi:aspartyl-tRNA(Asn)/glutamyl-tRNA(Gln) amidotransferase subunit A